MRRLTRGIKDGRPTEAGIEDGLAYSLWMPAKPPARGIVILHGAGSCKESHHDYARAAIATGFAAIAYDHRGHGSSDGPMDGRVLEDVGTIASLLRARMDRADAPVALRGSSMGGYLAIAAADGGNHEAASRIKAGAIVAICPASPDSLRRAMRSGRAPFHHDPESLEQVLTARELPNIVESLPMPLLLLHASGDEVVPVEHSRMLAERATNPHSRLVEMPGGHHRSIQHDPELQAFSLQWLDRVLA